MNSPVFCYCMEMKMLNFPVLSLFLLRCCSPQYQLNVACRGGCTLSPSSSSSRYQTFLQEGCKNQKKIQTMWKNQEKPWRQYAREGQPAHTTEASGSGGRKGNEGRTCGALVLSQNTSPCCHVENALFSAKPNPLPFSTGWAAARPAQCLDSHGSLVPARGTVIQGWKHTCSRQLPPLWRGTKPSLPHHQAKCSANLPAVHCWYLNLLKRQVLKRLGEGKRSKFTCPIPQCIHKADKTQPK